MRLRPSRTLLAALFLISASLASLQAQTVPPPMAPNWGRGGPFQPRATATAVPRIMVKFRPALGDAVEAALPTHPMSLSAGGTMPAQVAAFMAKYSARTLAPLYPDLVEAKKQRQVSALQLASEVRARYAKRASRLRAEFAPQDLSRTYVMETGAPPEAFAKILTAMKADPDLEYAEADKIVSVQLMPNDPYFSSYGSWGQAYYDLWGLHTINAASAWDTSTGAGIVVAVVDTGIDSTHPDIAANVVPGWDFIGSTYTNPQQDNNTMDVLGHGTHVAGTIAAIGNNDIGIIGVAWQAHVMPVKALDDTGSGLDSTLAPAIEYAANNGADVINASWGGEGSDQTIADAVNYAYNMGMVFVAAAGNSDADANYFYPAGLWDVITVAASDPTDAIASFSNWGSKIDVAAPGVGILSLRAAGSTLGTIVGNDYMVLDGTSMAAPHVSGLAALLLAKYPQYSNEDVRQAIRVSADNIGQPGFDMNFGYGRIDASAAVAVSGALEARINSPAEGTTAQRAVTISGVAQGSGFASYKLEYGLVPGPGLQPTTWTTLQTGTSPVSGTLGLFDATAVPDGAYIIRLTVYNTAGQGFVDEVQVTAAAVTITSPVPAQVPPAATTFKPGVTIPISGSTIASGFQSFQVAWARGSNPSSGWQTTGITLVQGGSVSVTGGPIATWDTSSITQADYYTIQLTVTASNFTNTTSTMVYFEPDLLSVNWPQWLGLTNEQSGIVPAADSAGNIRLAVSSRLFNGPPWAGSWSFSPDGSSQTTVNLNWGGYTEPAAGSLDGNPGEEVLVTDDVVLDVFSPIGTSPLTAFSSTDFDFAFDQMVLDDLAGDGQLETVALGNHYNPNTGNDGTAAVFAWRNNGQQLNANFPIPVADQNFLLYTSITSNRVLVGDIDGDGNQEIVVMAGTTATTYTPLLFGSDGLPRQWNAPSFNGKPNMMALADLDHNGKLELIFNNYGDGTLHVLQPDGSERPGWPQTVWGDSFAIGDLNQDGRYEIATWCNGNLCVFNTDGTSFSAAFPWAPPAGVSYAPVVLADINGDGYPEIITTYEVYQYTQESSSSLDAAARNSIPANAGPRIKTARQIGPDGRVAVRSVKTSAAAQSNDYQGAYPSETLVAIDRNGNTVRSWNLTGAYGQIAAPLPKITVGDFNDDGLTEIALSYAVYPVDGGWWVGGIAEVLATGAPFNPAANYWPMIYQNPQNNAVLGKSLSGGGTVPGGPGAPCTFTVNSNGESFPAAGGAATVNVTAPAGCQWTASSPLAWAAIVGTSSGSGSGTVNVAVSANTDWPGRSGAIAIAGSTFTVQQEGASFAGISPTGSLAQIAYGGGWDTSITILNLQPSQFLSSSAPAELDFFANDGSGSALPFTSPQQSFSGTMLSPTFGQNIDAYGQVILDASGSPTQPSSTAWAQLQASGPIGAFSIFKNNGQEAVVPLETRNAASYLLAFDNTGSIGTGLAIANLSTAAANVGVVIRDSTGAQTGTGTISLAARGHNSFMLTDATYGFPATAGQRGTIEFDTPAGGQISVLGLRANGAAITTLPVFANVGTGGGTLAHIASGGGWQTLLTLINTGASSAPVQLNFFDEQGNAMTLPLAFPQTGATATEPAVSQTLAAGASLLIQTQGTASQLSQVGSAQLTTSGNVSGFAIFQNSGQEAVVPLASGNPSAQFLVFDNTGGLATGMALANGSGSPAAVPVTLRNEAGWWLANTTINLPANGHTSFVLTDYFPAAANIRGSVEFDTPAGGQVSAIGIRATPAGAYTTIPVMTP